MMLTMRAPKAHLDTVVVGPMASPRSERRPLLLFHSLAVARVAPDSTLKNLHSYMVLLVGL